MSDSVGAHRPKPTRLWDSPTKNTGVGCHSLLQCMTVKSESEVAQSCLTLSDPMDCSPPGSSIYGIFQARVLEWGAIAFSEEVRSLSHSIVFCFFSHLRRLSYLSLLFFGIQHSDGYIFPFLLCVSVLFSVICKASSDNHFAFCISFSCSGLDHSLLYHVTNLRPYFFKHSVYQI